MKITFEMSFCLPKHAEEEVLGRFAETPETPRNLMETAKTDVSIHYTGTMSGVPPVQPCSVSATCSAARSVVMIHFFVR